MARGGRRSGKPGASYGNRTDLQQAPRVAGGQPYGVAQMQRQAQQAVPIAGTPMPAPGAAPMPAAGAPMPQGPLPGSLGFTDPSQRPGEPVQHGLPMGPGGGPEVLGNVPDANSAVATQLRAIYMRFPTEQMRGLIEQIDTGNDR